MMQCAYCQIKEAKRLCGACEFVPYCGEACADKHWPVHAVEAHLGALEGREAVADEIVPGLWLGGIKALKHLDELGIGAVVTAIQQDKDGVEKMLTKTVGDRPHLRFKWYDSPDQEMTHQEMCRAVGFIDQYLPKPLGLGKDSSRPEPKGSGVLVHCWAGHSRSVSIVLFYLMKKTRRFKSVAEALAFIQSKRPYIDPNPGFLLQLETLVRLPC
jgi:hypothetical protein